MCWCFNRPFIRSSKRVIKDIIMTKYTSRRNPVIKFSDYVKATLLVLGVIILAILLFKTIKNVQDDSDANLINTNLYPIVEEIEIRGEDDCYDYEEITKI